jgi:serine/threonine protein kinase
MGEGDEPMSASNASGDSFGDEIEILCDRFEAEWRSGGKPQIEPYVAAAPEGARPELVRELLKLDIYYRRDNGDTVTPDDYKSFLPEYAGLIETLVSSGNLNTMSEVFLAQIGNRERRFDIPPGQTTVGRNKDANIVLSNPSISRLHARFQRHGRVVWLTDLNSMNGTQVNDRSLESNQKVLLYPGDQIRFCHHLLDTDHHPPRALKFFIHGNWMTNLPFEDDKPDVGSTNNAPPSAPSAASLCPLAEHHHIGFCPSRESDWHPGDLIENRWEVQQVLHGGMAIVYVVLDLETGERLAAKTYRDDLLTANPDLARRFEREALAWINLDSHPNIVKAKYVRTLNHKPFLFLEYIEGGSLRGLLPSLCIGELPAFDPVDYGFMKFFERAGSCSGHFFQKSLQIQHLALSFCDGMIHASQFGIKSHRDIKPDNCLVCPRRGVGHGEWDLKITDFGLADIFDDLVPSPDLPYVVNVANEEVCTADSPLGETVYQARVPDWLSIFVTRTGAVAGTPSHMSPEHFNDIKHVDVRADIYSFGVMLYQMITGRLPFRANTWWGYRHRHQNVLLPEVHLGYFTDIVQCCLAKNPDLRYGSFLELRNAIQNSVVNPTTLLDGAEILPDVDWSSKSPSPGIELTDDELVQKGLSLAELGYCSLALNAFNHIIKRNPRCAKAWREKGNLLMKVVRNFPEALESLERAKQLGELGLEEQIAFCRDQLF